MLSIVIPIINQDVRKLVDTLLKQCQKTNIAFQILCFDDNSLPKYRQINQSLSSIIHVNYTEMTENLGRARIRNWLGKAAYYDYILFLDCDCVVKDKNFIKNYLKHLSPDTVICGGTHYSRSKPRSKKKILHWKYATKREALSAKKLNKEPYMNFRSNNFLIPSAVFAQNFFDEVAQEHGYEDILYAKILEEKNIKVIHIDNTILHNGLEIHTEFMKKTEKSIKNLAHLYKSGQLTKTRLILGYEKLRDYNLIKSFKWSYRKLENRIEDNFFIDNPSIPLFNLWKLRLFIKEIESENISS